MRHSEYRSVHGPRRRSYKLALKWETQYTVVEGGEQAELLEEINLTLKNIDVKLERVDAGLKEHRQRDLEQKLRCH